MEVGALFGRFVWRGINICDVTIHPSRGSRINPTLKVRTQPGRKRFTMLLNMKSLLIVTKQLVFFFGQKSIKNLPHQMFF